MRPSTRFRILQRDGFRCRYCGHAAPEARLEVDHIVPRSWGGKNDHDNLVTACSRCNGGKGTSTLGAPLVDCEDIADTAIEFCEYAEAMAGVGLTPEQVRILERRLFHILYEERFGVRCKDVPR